MNEERLRILEMLEQGKITAGEAGELLDALEASVSRKPGGQGSTLRIMVDSQSGEKVRVNVPLSLAKQALKLVPVGLEVAQQFSGKETRVFHNISQEELLALIENLGVGELVTIDDNNGNQVRIVVE